MKRVAKRKQLPMYQQQVIELSVISTQRNKSECEVLRELIDEEYGRAIESLMQASVPDHVEQDAVPA